AGSIKERGDVHVQLNKVLQHLARTEKSLGLSPESRKSLRIAIEPARTDNGDDDSEEFDFFGRWER
ncbi:MAG: hypothetical protein R6W89_08110, partial [Candidatus Hydrogenedentota bacterium]